jgi:hypothetical protein
MKPCSTRIRFQDTHRVPTFASTVLVCLPVAALLQPLLRRQVALRARNQLPGISRLGCGCPQYPKSPRRLNDRSRYRTKFPHKPFTALLSDKPVAMARVIRFSLGNYSAGHLPPTGRHLWP